MIPELPALQWSMQWSILAVPVAFALGALLATAVTFRYWRWGKKIVPRELWTRMVDGYVSLERAHRGLSTSQSDSQAAYGAISDRLDRSTQENHALQQRLRALESHLENVTTEATSLVTGLKDNEQRWADAELARSELETELDNTRTQATANAHESGSLAIANAELTLRLQTAAAELSSASREVERLQADLARRENLEARLHEALDRDRQQMATLNRLESRYQKTHDQLIDANRRSAFLEQQLQMEMPNDTVGETLGVFDRPVPQAQPITISSEELGAIDLRAALPPSQPVRRKTRRRRGAKADKLARSHGQLPE